METVQVWVAPLDVAPTVLASLAATLSPAERVRAGRFCFPVDARRFIAAHGWLRNVLGDTLGIAPAQLALTDGPGKPRLADEAAPRFNLSRSAGVALVAVAAHDVGVDVEHAVAEDVNVGLDLARVACTPAELAELHRLPPPVWGHALLRRWTVKEAFLKATGVGLALPPDQVEVGAEEPDGAVPVQAVGRPARWWARLLEPAPGYLGAVVAAGREWTVQIRSVADLGGQQPAAADCAVAP